MLWLCIDYAEIAEINENRFAVLTLPKRISGMQQGKEKWQQKVFQGVDQNIRALEAQLFSMK